MIDDKITKHESFGLVRLSRVSGKTILFGSSVDHHSYYDLTVFRAAHCRSVLHYDRVSAEEEILRISMSAVQLSEMLFNMNVGDGTPCTLTRVPVGGKYVSMKPPPSTTKQAEYEEEFKKEIGDLCSDLRALVSEAKAVEAKATATKGDRKALVAKAEKALQDLECNLPFILKMFNEKVEKVVGEAKGEIEAYQSHLIQATGLKALGAGQPNSGPLALPKGENE